MTSNQLRDLASTIRQAGLSSTVSKQSLERIGRALVTFGESVERRLDELEKKSKG